MAWRGTTLRLATDTSSLYCPLRKRMLLTCTVWVEALDTSDDGRKRIYGSCTCHLIGVSFIKSLKSNLCTAVTQ